MVEPCPSSPLHHIRTLGPLDYRRVSYLRLAVIVRAGLAAVLVAMAVGGNRRREAEEWEQCELHRGTPKCLGSKFRKTAKY